MKFGFTSSDEAVQGSSWRKTPWYLRMLGHPRTRKLIWYDHKTGQHHTKGKWVYFNDIY